MVNSLAHLDPARVKTYSIGFDRMFDRLLDDVYSNQSYPPYNIIHEKDDKYKIEIALAGFQKDDIEIETKENVLVIKTNDKLLNKEDDDQEYLHRGISKRHFERKFNLAEDVVVNGASLEHGLLVIDLERIIPEEKKPRLIDIK